MTIKILKQGRLPEEVTYKFNCNYCATEFTAQKKDGKSGSHPKNGQPVEVDCPVCASKCYSWNKYKEPDGSHHPGVSGWQDYVVEKYPPYSWKEDLTY